jgi:hypothetical protein
MKRFALDVIVYSIPKVVLDITDYLADHTSILVYFFNYLAT